MKKENKIELLKESIPVLVIGIIILFSFLFAYYFINFSPEMRQEGVRFENKMQLCRREYIRNLTAEEFFFCLEYLKNYEEKRKENN